MGGRLTTSIAAAFLLIALPLISMIPRTSFAVGTAADAICVASRCTMSPTPGHPLCSAVPCSDTTSGYISAGTCATPTQCLATQTGGGSITQISQLLSGIAQLMQAMQSQGGAGSGSATSAGCSQYYQVSTPSSDPCATYVPGSGTSTSDLLGSSLGSTGDNGTGAANQLISSLLGSNSNSNTNTNASNNSSGSIVPTASSSVPQGNLSPGTSANISQSAFGSSPGTAGDIQVISGNGVTILASNRDTAANKQTSGFLGFNAPAAQTPPTIFTSLCAARPWSAGFIALIIPSTILDNLCLTHGYSITPPTIAPAVVVTQAQTATVASTTAATTTPAYLGPLRADIWAVPPSVSSGSRTSIFWDSSGALSCAITSGNSSFTANTLAGSSASPALTANTTFSITCTSATSSASNQVIVTVQ